MLIQDLNLFNKLAESLGNRYAAVWYVSYLARKLASTLPLYIIESYLIHWVLSGEDLSEIRTKTHCPADVRFMEDVLSWVEDNAVCDAVREMYAESVREHHLIYKSAGLLDAPRQDRAKILLRMIWYQLD